MIDWDFIYQRPQHLAERLSLKNDFTFVQPFGLRNLRFSDYRRILRRSKALFKKVDINSGLHIKNFLFIPIFSPLVTKVNFFLLKHQMNSLMDPETIVWVTYPSPLIFSLLKGTRYRSLVYEMMDDYPKVHMESEELLRRMETWFVNKADLVIATSEALAEKAEEIKKGARIRVIGNGVDYNFFNNGPKVRPLELNGLEKIIGYVGLVSEWIDFELVDYLAEKRPDWNFIFVGPIRTNGDLYLPIKQNIHFIDMIDYEKVPTYCNSFDVCLIPFRRSEFADAINPVKFYEYLALGKPVVSYTMRELKRYQEIIYLAEGKEDFLTHLEAALNEKDDWIRERRREVAQKNDWTIISQVIDQELSKLIPL